MVGVAAALPRYAWALQFVFRLQRAADVLVDGPCVHLGLILLLGLVMGGRRHDAASVFSGTHRTMRATMATTSATTPQ